MLFSDWLASLNDRSLLHVNAQGRRGRPGLGLYPS